MGIFRRVGAGFDRASASALLGVSAVELETLTVFLALNGRTLVAPVADAVAFLLGIAAGEIDEGEAEAWIRGRLEAVG